MLAITFAPTLGAGWPSAAPIASFAGSILAVAIVYASSRAPAPWLSTNTLLLAGVTMNAFFSALILVRQFLSDFTDTFRILRWLMGDLDVSSYSRSSRRCRSLSCHSRGFAWLARPLNLLSIGTRRRQTRGLDVAAQRVPSSARRSRPARRCRSAVRLASSGSSFLIWYG